MISRKFFYILQKRLHGKYFDCRFHVIFFAASAKKKDANMIVRDGTDILKQLYKSKDDQIKVRALVGLCKLASSSGHDASLRPFADGSSGKLAEACRRILIHPGKDREMRRWACEGLVSFTQCENKRNVLSPGWQGCSWIWKISVV